MPHQVDEWVKRIAGTFTQELKHYPVSFTPAAIPGLSDHLKASTSGIVKALFQSPTPPTVASFIETANACQLLLATGGVDPAPFHASACKIIETQAWVACANCLRTAYESASVENTLATLNSELEVLERAKEKRASAFLRIRSEAETLKNEKALEEERLIILRAQVAAAEQKIVTLEGAYEQLAVKVKSAGHKLGQTEHKMEEVTRK